MNAIDTRVVNNLTVNVYVDEDSSCADPRDRDGNGGLVLVDGYGYAESPRLMVNDAGLSSLGNFDSWSEVADEVRRVERERGTSVVCILPIFGGFYGSRGWALDTGEMSEVGMNRWDSRQVGFTYVTRAHLEEWGTIEPRADIPQSLLLEVEAGLRSGVKEYCYWLNGEVYGYTVTTSSGTILDSCRGFVGGTDYALSEGVSVAESYTAEDMIRADMEVLIAESRKVREHGVELAHEIAELRIALNKVTREEVDS